MWTNKYIGIPYKDNGRDTAGIDCWGLVRLVYKDEFNIELPSFTEDYQISDTDRIVELMSQYREGWEKLEAPEEGCIVLFNIYGQPSHVGIMLDDKTFLHTSRSCDVSLEQITSMRWEKRLEGFYKYVDKTKEKLKELPISLKTKALEIEFPEGYTTGDALDSIKNSENISEELKSKLLMYLDGELVESRDIVLKTGQVIEYRVVPDDNKTLNTVLTVAVFITAAYVTGGITAGTGVFSGVTAWAGGAGSIGASALGVVSGMAVSAIGMALVSAIAPVRPPDPVVASSGMDSSNPQNLLTGSRNETRQYEAIPVVLGTYRLVAPCAAVNYLVVDTDISYLKMLLTWGYGPVALSDIRVGATLIGDYLDDVTAAHVYGYPSDDLSGIFSLYGPDTIQIAPNIELPFTEPSGNATDYITRTIGTPVNSISVSINFPQGLRGTDREGGNAGNYYAIPFSASVEIQELDPTTLLPLNGGVGVGAWQFPKLSFLGKNISLQPSLNKTSAVPPTSATTPTAGAAGWMYASGYTTNIIYVSAAGDLGIIAGPGYTNLTDTATITGATFLQNGYSNKTYDYLFSGAAPTYSYSATTPIIPAGALALYKIVLYSNVAGSNNWLLGLAYPGTPSVISTTDLRTANGITSGGVISYAGTVATLTAGSTNLAISTLNYGLSGQPFYLRKDGFTANVSFNTVPNAASGVAPYNVRVKRLSSALFDFSSSTNKPYYYNKAGLYLITGSNSYVNAVKPPVNTNLALSAFRIRATDQLNGSIEGINALVSSICLDYELNTYSAVTTAPLATTITTNTITISNRTQWLTIADKLFIGSTITGHAGFTGTVTITNIVDNATTIVITFSANATATNAGTTYNIVNNLWTPRATSNPAALFRYVLQHSANMQAIAPADVSTKMDLTALQNWHTYCKTNSFTYNAVIVQHKSLLEVLKDISAAGRASPMLINGKWGVVIDQPRTSIVQHFTPHNSWGFEGTRVLLTPPHALRVNFISEIDDYQTKEITVYSFATKQVSISTSAGSAVATTATPLIPAISSGSTTYTITFTSGPNIPAGITATVNTGSTTLNLSTTSGVLAGTALHGLNVPYTPSTATIFETIQLPGVTNATAAQKHAKFNLAQAMLRRESYSLNADMEHIVCNRGDLVKITHDVPMWGMATGRIKNFIDTSNIEVSEPVLLDPGITYTIRIRLADASSITRNIQPVLSQSYYTTLNLSPTLTSTEGAPNNLFMLGILNAESADMVVTSIEPATNLTAKINLVDYAPAIYNSDTTFYGLPSYNVQITTPISYSANYITSIPTVVTSSIRSDESVMAIVGSSYVFKISIPYTNDVGLETNITDVEYRLCLTADTAKSWRITGIVPLSAGSVLISDVYEGKQYSFQLRYSSASGYVGPWTQEFTHTIVGKSNPPSAVTGFSATEDVATLKLLWNDNPELDVVGYEVRIADTGWGTAGYVYLGSTTSCNIPIPANSTTTWYIRAVDVGGLYSLTSASLTKTYTGPLAVTIGLNLAGPNEILSWNIPFSNFAVDRYEIRTGGTTWATATFFDSTKATSYSHKVDYSGIRKYWITAVDTSGRYGASSSIDVNITIPGGVQAIRTDIIDNNALIYWNPPATGTLPIDRYEVRKGASFAAGTIIGSNGNSTFTTVFEQQSGTYLYWVAAVDTAGNFGTAVSVTAVINQPPDYVLRANINSTFTGTKTSALTYTGGLLVPVNITESYSQHYTNNGWTTLQNQISAGNTIYIQPSTTSASYSEVFDYGSVIPTSNITVTLSSIPISGTVTSSCQIQWSNISATGPWTSATAGLTTTIATNFRWVQVIYTFTATGTTNLLQITALNLKIAIKQRSDSGTATVLNGATSASVTFGYSFISADTPIVQPNFATPIIPVVTYAGGANPTGFSVSFYSASTGALITAPAGGIPFSWTVRGY